MPLSFHLYLGLPGYLLSLCLSTRTQGFSSYANLALHYFVSLIVWVLVLVALRSKAYVWGRSTAEIVGSNPTGGMNVCLLLMLCVVRYRSQRRANPSSRGVIPSVVCRCVWSRNHVNEEALTHWGLLRQLKKLRR